MVSESTYFRSWLIFVFFGRVLGIFLGYVSPATLRQRVYPYVKNKDFINPVFGRMWSNWTMVSVSLLLALIYDTTNLTVYVLNMFAFFLAFSYFFVETFYYRIGSGTNLAMISVFAGVTFIWMIARLIHGDAYVL